MSYQPFSTTRPTDSGPFIHILDDYSLLNIFFLTRPAILDDSEVDNSQFLEDGKFDGEWNLERWWYRLVQVCRRWRYIVLESASHLRLSLVCARGTPVGDMLAHSTPLPLVINYFFSGNKITAEEEKGLALALQHRDRVRRIRFKGTAPVLQKLSNSLDGEFSILEYLFIELQRIPWSFDDDANFPETFRAPHLRHLLLTNFDIPIGSPLLTTGSIVTLSLNSLPRSTYFDPNASLKRVSSMPQLETLRIYFDPDYPTQSERQLLRRPIKTRVTLPNLRWLELKGDSDYLEVLLPHVTLPLLEKFQIYFFNQVASYMPHLQQFISTTEDLQPNSITLAFHSQCVEVMTYPNEGAVMHTLSLSLGARSLHWQVESAIQLFRTLSMAFSTVEHLTLQYDIPQDMPTKPSRRIEPGRTQWHELLRLFANVKTLFVDGCLVWELSHALQPGTRESHTQLLPELKELSCPAKAYFANAFTPFIDARVRAGRPVTMIRL